MFSRFRKKKEILVDSSSAVHWLEEYLESYDIRLLYDTFAKDAKRILSSIRSAIGTLSEVKSKGTVSRKIKEYVDIVGSFLEDVSFPKKLIEVNSFAESFSEDVETVIERIAAYYYVLKDVNVVVIKLQGHFDELDKIVAGFRTDVGRMKLDAVFLTFDKFKLYSKACADKKEVDKEIALLKTNKSLLEKKLEKFEKRITDLSGSSHNKYLLDLEEEYTHVKAEIASFEEEFGLLRLAAPLIGKSIRKKLLLAYCELPLETFVSDDSLILVDLLGEIISFAKKDTDLAKKLKEFKKKSTKTVLLGKKHMLTELLSKKHELEKRMKKDTTKLMLDEQRSYENITRNELNETIHKIRSLTDQHRISCNLAFQDVRDAFKKIDELIVFEVQE